MKNFFRSMMLVAVAAMGFAACSTENTNDPAVEFEPNMVEMSIIAEQTRTVLDSSEAFANWEASDKIAVFEVADAISITESTKTILNDGLASFRFSFTENTTAPSFDYYAVYPYANVVDKESDKYETATMGKIKLNTPATQNPKATSFDGGADLLLSRPVTDLTAQPSEAMSMAFTRVVALAKMTLKNLDTTDPIINVTFTAPADKILAGRSYFDLTTSQVYTDNEGDGYGYTSATNTITLNCPSLVNVAAGTPIYFTTLPTELVAGETFTVTVSTENKKFTKEVTIPDGRNIAFVAGDMASFGVNMNGANVETIENLAGDYIIAGKNGVIMSSTFADYAGGSVEDVANDTEYPYTDESIVWVIENGDEAGQYYIKNKSLGTYVGWNGSGNTAQLQAEPYALTIKQNDNGTYAVTSVADTTRKLQDNNTAAYFRFYAGTQNDLYLVPAVADTKPRISVDEQPAQVAAAGAEVTVNLTTANITEDITATTEAEWIIGATVTDDVLTFTVAANDVEEEREATIILSANGASATVTVSQAGKGEPEEAYVKVTEALADYSGQYLIVYESGKVAFDGSLTTLDAANNGSAVTITDNKIAASDAMHDISFTIAKSGTDYTIMSASGNYIGVSSNSNGLKQTTTATTYKHTISVTNGAVDVKANFSSSTMSLRYNDTSGQDRFRYYKNASQKAIALYKLTTTGGGTDEPETPVTPTKLTTPTVTTSVNGNVVTVSWNAVANATSYDVTCGTKSQTGVTGTSTTFEEMGWNATYNVTVIAKSTDANYTDSEAGTTTAIVGEDPNAGGGEGGETEPITETLNVFAKEGTLSNKVITWESDNFTLSNAQASSQTAIRTSDSDHYRIYAKSILTFTAKNGYKITKIVITCTGTSYVNAMENSLTGSTASGSIVTWEGTAAAEVSATMTAQSRINKVEVTLAK